MIPTMRTARFLRTYVRGGAGPVREEELTVEVGGEPREATLYLPDRPRPAPGWVVLHGLTVPGRRHRAMVRFVRSLSASGAAVLVPDVPSWRELRMDLAAARQTLESGAAFLARRPEVQPGGVGAVGFSFGATQALLAMADPAMQGTIRAVVSFGGYADPARMVESLFTGRHEWRGVEHRLDPDPYGRWIMAANYLTHIPRFADMEAVAHAARALALHSGQVGLMAWEPSYDAKKEELRRGLSPRQRELWDVIAPPTGRPPPEPEAVRELVDAFAWATTDLTPMLDPRPHLGALRGRVVLSHGRADRLIPYTETLRLESILPPAVQTRAIITGLFAHSTHAPWMAPLDRLRESSQFIRLLNGALAAV